MLAGVLEFKAKTVEDVMTPKTDMFLLDEDEILDFDTMQKIQVSRHRRCTTRGFSADYYSTAAVIRRHTSELMYSKSPTGSRGNGVDLL